MKPKKKSLYLYIHISPAGFKYITIRLSKEKPDPIHICHGEGNCLAFKYIDGDYSNSFYEAMETGEAIDALNERIELYLEKGSKI